MELALINIYMSVLRKVRISSNSRRTDFLIRSYRLIMRILKMAQRRSLRNWTFRSGLLHRILRPDGHASFISPNIHFIYFAI